VGRKKKLGRQWDRPGHETKNSRGFIKPDRAGTEGTVLRPTVVGETAVLSERTQEGHPRNKPPTRKKTLTDEETVLGRPTK